MMKEFTVETNEYNCEVNKGEQFSIILAGNATTGYGWYLKNEDAKLNPLNLNEYKGSSDYVNDTSGLMGAPGKWHFKFEAVENGDAELNFCYERPWEKGNGKKFKVMVNIK